MSKMSTYGKRGAFTLVELLVVIAIIALLLSILVPALAKAREQARLMICSANCKQIGTYIALYQTDCEGFVPVVLNQSIIQSQPQQPKYHLVSVALAAYAPETANPSPSNPFISLLNPNVPWTDQLWYPTNQQRYYTYLLPKQYCCPFTRGSKANYTATPGTVVLGGHTVNTVTTAGYRDTFATWIRVAGNYAGHVWWQNHPAGRDYGIEKYGVLPWNRSQETQTQEEGGWHVNNPGEGWPWVTNNPIKWGKLNLQATRAGSLADATVLYCTQGQWDGYAYINSGSNGIINYGSHKKGGLGGTNAVFGDTHTDWVNGFQIGWP
jgi:prepilin-type N-terminal cleavage/methylation domain-containing protein